MLNNINLSCDPDTFEPGMFSTPELHFLLEHLKEPPVAAFHDFDPDGKHRGVFRARAGVALQRFYELTELQTHRGIVWAGYEAITDAIIRFLAWQDRSHEIERRGGPTNPSMWVWDDTGHPYKYAIGADSAEMVRTEILDTGDRKPFGVKLTQTAADALRRDLSDVAPWIKRADNATVRADKLEVVTQGQMGRVICPVCGKTEEFAAGDRGKLANARARMAKHLKTATQEVNRHRILYTKEYK